MIYCSYNEIISFKMLFDSYLKCRKGVTWKDSVASFELNNMREINRLHDDLVEGRYIPRKTSKFVITSPKRREIVSISFRDRVYQRSLNDNALYPIMTNSFIYDNCACQKDKGTDFTRNRTKKHLSKFYRNHGSQGYVLKIDIKQYYKSMNHELTEQMFTQQIHDRQIVDATIGILRSQYTEQQGYNPGSQMVQIAGVSFLNGLDHFIKENLRIKHYIRYMDDLIIIHHSNDYLQYCLKKIATYLQTLKLEINKKKTKILELEQGFDFMGFKFRLTKTGKVLMLIKSESVKRERRHLKGLVRRVKNGFMTREEVDQCYTSWKAYVRKGNTHNVIIKMDRYYDELWR